MPNSFPAIARYGLFILWFSYSGCMGQSSESYLLSLYNQEKYQLVVEKADSILKGEPENLSRIYQIKADALYFLNQVEESLENYLLTVSVLDEYPLDTVYLIESYSHTGFTYKYLGKYLDAIPYYKMALSICRAADDSLEISNQLAHLGTLYSHLGMYQESAAYYNEGYAIDFALNDSTALAYDLVNLGDLKCSIMEYPQAVDYYKRALKVKSTKAGNHNTHVLRLGKLSEAYLKMGELDSATFYSRMAEEAAIDLNDSLSLAKQWITKTKIFNAKGEFPAATRVGNLCYNYFKEVGQGQYQVASALALAQAHNGLSNKDRADYLLIQAALIAEENGLLEDQALVYREMASEQERYGNQKDALTYYKRYQAIRDTLSKRDKQRAILILDREYQTNQKEQQIALLEAKALVAELKLAERKQNIVLLLTVIFLLLVVGLIVILSIRRSNRLQKSLLTAQVNELRLQIRSLVDGSAEDLGIEIQQLNDSIQDPLSERELEVLKFALSDLTNTEIAEKVFVSVNTVKFHLKNIYSKLGVANRKEALKMAMKSSSK